MENLIYSDVAIKSAQDFPYQKRSLRIPALCGDAVQLKGPTKSINAKSIMISNSDIHSFSTPIEDMIHSNKEETYRVISFPSKLYNLLQDAEARGFSDIISWQKGGQSFKIHRVEEFASQIMISYFSQTKFKSFQRQLNIYGWKKVQVGLNKGGYYHRDFIRGCEELCGNIVRRRSKDFSVPCILPSTKKSSFVAWTTPVDDYHFDSGAPVAFSNNVVRAGLSDNIRLEESEVAALFEFFYPKDLLEDPLMQRAFNSSPAPIQTFCKTEWNDKDNDLTVFQFERSDLNEFMTAFESEDESCIIQQSQDENDIFQEPHDNCFPYKLHLMLENAERDNYNHIVSWVKGGTAFKVHNSKEFVAQVMPMFFDQSKYESFRRQLNLYQFTREARGCDRGIISHPQFMKGARWLCEEIKKARFLGRY